MRRYGSIRFLVIMVLVNLITGCTGRSPISNDVADLACAGMLVQGSLRDSLSGLPIINAEVVVEHGAKVLFSNMYSFTADPPSLVDSEGGFRICTSSASLPAVLLVEATDPSGNDYPPFLKSLSSSANVGPIRIGGCTLICGLLDKNKLQHQLQFLVVSLALRTRSRGL